MARLSISTPTGRGHPRHYSGELYMDSRRYPAGHSEDSEPIVAARFSLPSIDGRSVVLSLSIDEVANLSRELAAWHERNKNFRYFPHIEV